MAAPDDAVAPFKSRRKMEERKGYTFFSFFFNPLLIFKKESAEMAIRER